MCDCHQDRDDHSSQMTISDDVCSDIQSLLFPKCKDFRNPKDSEGWKTTVLLEPPTNDYIQMEETLKPPSPYCSSDSTREYKFVDPREYEFRCGEEETLEYPRLSCRPCISGEEEEKEEGEENEPDIECTLAIIKPDAMPYRNDIENRILDESFEIYQTRWLQLTPEQTSDFYTDCYEQTNFAHVVFHMSSAPIIVMVLAKHHGIRDWRSAMGPTKVSEAQLYFPDSIRAQFGRRGEDFKNAVHGSSCRTQAEREIHFFFPDFIIEPLLKGEMAVDYLWEVINAVLLEGLTLCCKRKPADPILWLANWLILNNPNRPKLVEDLALKQPPLEDMGV